MTAAFLPTLVFAGGIALAPAEGDIQSVQVLTAADLSPWRAREFSGETRYTPVEIDGRRAVMAASDAAASGLYREVAVDLQETPVIHWSWRVDNTLGEIDERSKGGDDYPARVYVLSAHPVFFWKTRALIYVWSSAQPRESDWPNAYADNVRVIAVRSGERGLGQWQDEKRNVREDFKRYFGVDVRYVNAVAFMTDTDNTTREATAYYGDIYFAGK